VTGDSTPPSDHRRFPLLDDPERPPRPWRWWLPLAAGVVIVAGVIAVTGRSSSPRIPTPTPSTALRPHLPRAAQPLPGATGGPAESFGTLGRHAVQPSDVTRSQALQRYDRIAGVISRRGSSQRVFTALIRAAFIDRGQLRRGTFWIISVWYHPPSIGVSPQHQWCVDHGIVNAISATAVGHISGCVPIGRQPRRLQ
jgi:hypothetical protein